MGAVLSVVWGWLSPGTQVGAVTFPEEGSLGPEADVPDKTTGLTLRHRTAIYRTWDLVRPNPKLHGINLFLTMFQEEPVLQTRFKGFAGKSIEELKNSKRLAAHGTTVVMAITAMVDNLEDVSVLVELLKNTGANHRDRGVPKGDFELLAPVLVRFLKDNLGSAWSPVAEEAWTQAMKVINAVIFTSYDA
uniref:Hemoglobin n=1 Tax=Carcinus maenas TaxID=6759 RepID=D8MIW2_CARMA|nr:hemoglobin [Carcinus maenas]